MNGRWPDAGVPRAAPDDVGDGSSSSSSSSSLRVEGRTSWVDRRITAARTRFAAAVILMGAGAVFGTTAALWWARPALRLSEDAPRPALGVRINVNSADAAALAVLPGIGPALADRIIAEREAHGPFRDVDDLQRVSGVGPRTAARLTALVAF